MIRISLVLTAALATLCACKQPAPERASRLETAAAAPAAKPAATPLSFVQDTPDAHVALNLDVAGKAWPAMQAALYDEETADLKAFAVQAKTDRAAARTPDYAPRPYARQIDWRVAAASGPVVSLRGLGYEDTGGAHPSHGSMARLWLAPAGRFIKPEEFFGSGADMSSLDKALCDAVTAAKSKRGGEPLGDPWTCPHWNGTRIAPVASTVAGKFGGLAVMIDPYIVGPYAEGDYEVIIPQAKIIDLVAPPYKPLFAGAPADPGSPDGALTQQMKPG